MPTRRSTSRVLFELCAVTTAASFAHAQQPVAAASLASSDGKQLVWASNRNGKQPHETNIFIADWVE